MHVLSVYGAIICTLDSTRVFRGCVVIFLHFEHMDHFEIANRGKEQQLHRFVYMKKFVLLKTDVFVLTPCFDS